MAFPGQIGRPSQKPVKKTKRDSQAALQVQGSLSSLRPLPAEWAVQVSPPAACQVARRTVGYPTPPWPYRHSDPRSEGFFDLLKLPEWVDALEQTLQTDTLLQETLQGCPAV